MLLSREHFKSLVLARHNGQCCVPGCGNKAQDAHHILDRKLWEDGGYYAQNGAALCHAHHWQAETTELSVEDLRAWSFITDACVPSYLDPKEKMDKWGNPVLPNKTRLRGPLFEHENVQKALKQGDMLALFTHWVKYPKTFHLPWSEGVQHDDRRLKTLDHFVGQEVVVSEKYDGENTTLYQDHFHARSLDSKHHPSRDWMKGFWASVRQDIPPAWRLVMENCTAVHSIYYKALPAKAIGLSLWNEKNVCLSWPETLEWFSLIGQNAGISIRPPHILYEGIWDPKAIQEAWRGYAKQEQEREGYVVRKKSMFSYADFSTSLAKFVRKNHVQTDQHWMQAAFKTNGLQKDPSCD